MTAARPRPHIRPARDRHGRGLHGPLLPQQTPRYRSARELFDAAVLEAYAPIQHAFAPQLRGLDLAVDTIPRMRLSADMTVLPDEIIADGPVPLGRIVPAGVDSAGTPTRARLVIFRMPIEQRAVTSAERAELLGTVITALVANYLNLAPEEVDPRYGW
ncbi:metallopeptidase family protein [Corynebacterium sp. KPL2830]|uniref:metallopeptidase family protein n=1 Tax=unclassified Corynebacterium TaxID=2624378 RepID=UPI0032EF12D8